MRVEVYWLIAAMAAIVTVAAMAIMVVDIITSRRHNREMRKLVARLEHDIAAVPYPREHVLNILKQSLSLEEKRSEWARTVNVQVADDPVEAARAFVSEGIGLRISGRPLEAIALLDRVLLRFGHDTPDAVREPLARALFNVGDAWLDLGHWDEGVDAFNELITRFDNDIDPAIRELIDLAYFSRALCWVRLNRMDQALPDFREFRARVGADTRPAIRQRSNVALYDQGVILATMGLVDDAVAVLEAARENAEHEPSTHDVVAAAMAGLAAVYTIANRDEVANGIRAAFEHRFGETTAAWLQRHTF